MIAFILSNENWNLKCKVKFFATQSGKSRDPTLGRDPQFALEGTK